MISENMYMQYFCGLPGFQKEKPFDASLFVDIRKRMGKDKFDEFNRVVIEKSEKIKPRRQRIIRQNTEKEPKQEKSGKESTRTDSNSNNNKG